MRPTARSLARAALAAGAVSILVASLVGGAVAAALFVASVVFFPAALIVLGPARARPIAAGLALLLAASAAALILLRPGGLAPMLLGMGLAPLVLVSWGYAATD